MPVSTQSSYLEFVSEVSSRFVSISLEKIDGEIGHALRRISGLFAVDYCAIYQARGTDGDVVLAHEIDGWRTSPGGPGPESAQDAGSNGRAPVPRLFREVLRTKRTLWLRTHDDLPAGAELDRAQLARCGIESLLLVPIATCTSIDYLFVAASAGAREAWTKEHLSQISLLAEILVSAICRSGMQKALRRTTRDLREAHRDYRLGRWEWEVGGGRIVEMEAVDRILGIRPDTQADFMELVHASDRPLLQKAIDNALCNNRSELLVEYRMRTRRGDLRIVMSRFEVADSERGVRMTGSFQDVTSARRSEQELQLLRSQYWHADRVAHIGVLVASLAHELSQPLTAILSNAQAGLRFLSHEPLDQQEICDIMNDIVADNRRARHIIDALRGMIRGEKTGRARIDAADTVREVLALLHSEFVAQQVEVELACSSACFVLADKAQIEQVMLNLMLNSVESMCRQPTDRRRILIEVRCTGEREVQVAVGDTGAGIPHEELANVFEPFWTTKVHGLGMGLAVCRSIIEAHGGRIWAERNMDGGATFRFRLPSIA